MSSLSIGIVSSEDKEAKILISLLKEQGLNVFYHLTPNEITQQHIESKEISVWLLSVDDDHWHDNIDTLLDESDASIYFNEPGTLNREEHLEYWCRNLVDRLYEVSGVEKIGSNQNHQLEVEGESTSSISVLDSALDELQTTSVGLPSDVAAELVNELEEISPQLKVEESDISPDPKQVNLKDLDLNEILIEDLNLDDIGLEKSQLEELSTDEKIGFIDAAVKSHESKVTDTVNTQLNENKNQSRDLEEINFDNLAIPSLESARDENSIELQSEYTLEEDEPESSGDEMALATTKEYQDAIEEKLRELTELEDTIADLGSDLTVERLDTGIKTTEELLKEQTLKDNELDESVDEIVLDGIDINFSLENEFEGIEGKAEFLVDDEILPSEEDEKIGLIDESKLIDEMIPSEFSLESENEVIEGKAVFNIEEIEINEVEQNSEEEKLHSQLISTENALDGLSLEPTEEAVIGKAVYTSKEEEIESKNSVKNTEESNELLDEALVNAGLNLESDMQNEGKAVFDIDSNEEDIFVEESKQEATEIVPEEPNEFSLNEGDDDAFSIVLNNNFLDEIDNSETIADDLLEDSTDINNDLTANVPEETTELTFEIPMLEDAATDVEFAKEEDSRSSLTPCWIIGASLGGPAAVKRFMQNIPEDINASFIVVQHIDENFLPVLADILTTNSHFDVKIASGSNLLSPGSVFLAPLKGKLSFLRDGSMLVDHSQSWTAPYSPCIDDVMENLVSVYGEQCGAIVFSGMGQDGLIGAKKLKGVNADVWAQSIETCANPSMPQSIINEGLANVVATPESLADQLVKKLSST